MYRLGGEEFLIVLPGVDATEGSRVAERLRRAVEEALPGGLNVTVSAGVAAARGDAVDYERLFNAADAALYRAKWDGRNRVAVAPEEAEAPPAPRVGLSVPVPV
jgi:diguanylate cyclase (GGDEF)-like protein